jgi:AraC-like DNA-binding protein
MAPRNKLSLVSSQDDGPARLEESSILPNYTMLERATHADFSVRNHADALPNPAPHRHEYFQIHVQVKGDTAHYLGSTTRPVGSGTVCFVSPFKLHFIPTVAGAEYFLVNASQSFLLPGLTVDPLDLEDVSLEQAPELAPFNFQPYADFVFEGDELATVIRLCESMMTESRARAPGSTVLCRAYLHQLIGMACRRYGDRLWHLAESRVARTSRRETLVELGRFMRANFQKPLSLADAAEAVGLTPTYLAHVVKKETGRTFLELLTERRLDRAKELIVHTALPIAKIAEMAGFADFAYFTRRFKQLTGSSPSRYRATER